jgi:hypothetical protein
LHYFVQFRLDLLWRASNHRISVVYIIRSFSLDEGIAIIIIARFPRKESDLLNTQIMIIQSLL